MTQEIIVYRNPGEKLLWDWFLNSDLVTCFFAGLIGVLTLCVAYVTIKAICYEVSDRIRRFRNSFRRNRY